jgi:SAM-dependent methyltransferase
MGPHALWLLESLTEILPIEAGARILDLGCGRAMTSIFLAKEFGARVWATDLWIQASDNHKRIVSAGVEDLVTAIHAEAHTLPFASDFFDIIVSIDAYQYFGTADLYLGYLVNFLRGGARIGAVMPAMLTENANIPEHLAPFWDWKFCCFHGPDWWRRLAPRGNRKFRGHAPSRSGSAPRFHPHCRDQQRAVVGRCVRAMSPFEP